MKKHIATQLIIAVFILLTAGGVSAAEEKKTKTPMNAGGASAAEEKKALKSVAEEKKAPTSKPLQNLPVETTKKVEDVPVVHKSEEITSPDTTPITTQPVPATKPVPVTQPVVITQPNPTPTVAPVKTDTKEPLTSPTPATSQKKPPVIEQGSTEEVRRPNEEPIGIGNVDPDEIKQSQPETQKQPVREEPEKAPVQDNKSNESTVKSEVKSAFFEVFNKKPKKETESSLKTIEKAIKPPIAFLNQTNPITNLYQSNSLSREIAVQLINLAVVLLIAGLALLRPSVVTSSYQKIKQLVPFGKKQEKKQFKIPYIELLR